MVKFISSRCDYSHRISVLISLILGHENQAFLLKFSVFSFVIVAILGVLMRYKIAFSLPFVEQKHLQEAHSHLLFMASSLRAFTF